MTAPKKTAQDYSMDTPAQQKGHALARKVSAYCKLSEVEGLYRDNLLFEIEDLIKDGADLNIRHGSTGLYNNNNVFLESARTGEEELFKILLPYHLDKLEDGGYWGQTALIQAASHPKGTDIVEALLDHGADIESCDEVEEKTPFLSSLRSGCLETMTLLYRRGANIFAKTGENQSALHLICQYGCVDGFQFFFPKLKDKCLHSQTARGKTALSLCAESNMGFKMIPDLLTAGANINAPVGDFKETPLMLASVSQYTTDNVKCLIEHGADVNALDYIGRTALMHAARKHRAQENLRLLADVGADVNVQDHNGNTALMHVALSESRFMMGLDLYERYHANPFVKNKQGQDFFDIAGLSENKDMLDLSNEIQRREKECFDKYKKAFYECATGGTQKKICTQKKAQFKKGLHKK